MIEFVTTGTELGRAIDNILLYVNDDWVESEFPGRVLVCLDEAGVTMFGAPCNYSAASQTLGDDLPEYAVLFEVEGEDLREVAKTFRGKGNSKAGTLSLGYEGGSLYVFETRKGPDEEGVMDLDAWSPQLGWTKYVDLFTCWSPPSFEGVTEKGPVLLAYQSKLWLPLSRVKSDEKDVIDVWHDYRGDGQWRSHVKIGPSFRAVLQPLLRRETIAHLGESASRCMWL